MEGEENMINNTWIEVDLKAIRKRYEIIKENTCADIIPVIKNNSNGLGFRQMLDIYKSLGVKMIAASYASEFYFNAREDDDILKLAWIWKPCKELLEIKNIVLCCKNFNQLCFCIENRIPYHIVFNIGMNRGGFKDSEIEEIKKYAGNNWSIATHCPYSEEEDIKRYTKEVENLKNKIESFDIKIDFIHAANSVVFRTDRMCHFDGVRLGEILLLPNNDKFGFYDPISVKTTILDIMDLKKGDNIGYNHFCLEQDETVAVIPIGYYNFEKVEKVMIKDEIMDVLVQLHDLTMVKINKNKISEIAINDEVIINNFLLSQAGNWNKCIQRTFKFNHDLIGYKYIS